MKNSFVLYYEFKDSIELLSDEEAGQILKAIYKYECDGEITEFSDRLLKVLFSSVRNSLDRNDEKYKQTCEKNKKVVEARWKKAKGKENIQKDTPVYECIRSDTKNTDSDSERISDSERERNRVCDSDSDSVSDRECVNENDNVNEYVYVNDSEPKKETGLPSEENIHTQKIILGKFQNVYLSKQEFEELKFFYRGDWERRVESMSAYMKSSGKNYDNHYARLCEWQLYKNTDGSAPEKLPEKKDEPSYDIDAFMKQAINLKYVKNADRDDSGSTF